MAEADISFVHLGITIENLKNQISVFGFSIAYYGIIIGIGMLTGIWVAQNDAKRRGQDPDIYLDFALYGIIFAIIGARLYYVIFSWDFYSAHPEKIFALREGGLAIYGGIIGGVVTAIVYCKRKGVNFWLLADTIAPCLAFGQMLGRWGNFFNREAFGGFTNGLLAMRLQMSQVRTSDISAEVMQHIVNYGGVDYIQVHPTFLYESLWNLCLFLLLIKFRPKKKFDGQVLGLYFLGYALGRVWIEGLRTDQLMIGPFAVSQLLSGVLIICAAVFLIRKGKQEKAKKESES